MVFSGRLVANWHLKLLMKTTFHTVSAISISEHFQMNLLLIYGFIISNIGPVENTGSMSYADVFNVDIYQ